MVEKIGRPVMEFLNRAAQFRAFLLRFTVQHQLSHKWWAVKWPEFVMLGRWLRPAYCASTSVTFEPARHTASLLNSPDLRFVARDGIRASKDGRAGGLRGLLGTKLRWDQRKDSF